MNKIQNYDHKRRNNWFSKQQNMNIKMSEVLYTYPGSLDSCMKNNFHSFPRTSKICDFFIIIKASLGLQLFLFLIF